jgi:hypothetical protein
MSLKWPNKDPDETLDYSIDWSRFLGNATIVSATWFVDAADGTKTQLSDSGPLVNGIQLVSSSVNSTNTVATANIGSGTNNVRYKFTCQITDSNGLVVERTVFLRVREK